MNFDYILQSCFEETPRGDRNRVNRVASAIMGLMVNGLYAIPWLNAKVVN